MRENVGVERIVSPTMHADYGHVNFPPSAPSSSLLCSSPHYCVLYILSLVVQKKKKGCIYCVVAL